MRDTMFRFCYRALQEKGERVRILRLACADPTVIDLDLRFDLMSSTADRASCWHRLGPGGQPRVLRPRGGQLPALLQVPRRARPARAPVPVLLDGQVPHVPGVAAVVPQHRLLGGRGEQPEPGHANTLSDSADIFGEVTRRVLPGLKAGASTPRSR